MFASRASKHTLLVTRVASAWEREGSSSGHVGFCNSVRQSGGIRRRPLPRNARFEHNAPVEMFRERPQEFMSQPNNPHKLTKAAEPWLGGGAASGGSNCTLASRRLQFAPATACWSRQPSCRYCRPAWRAAFAA